jgi:hypothetical protein
MAVIRTPHRSKKRIVADDRLHISSMMSGKLRFESVCLRKNISETTQKKYSDRKKVATSIPEKNDLEHCSGIARACTVLIEGMSASQHPDDKRYAHFSFAMMATNPNPKNQVRKAALDVRNHRHHPHEC